VNAGQRGGWKRGGKKIMGGGESSQITMAMHKKKKGTSQSNGKRKPYRVENDKTGRECASSTEKEVSDTEEREGSSA